MSSFKIEKLAAGSGAAARKGGFATVHYTGWLSDGQKFDSSRDREEPFRFLLGAKQVIAGWERVVPTLVVGDKVRVTLPPELAYGRGGYPGLIPPGATLVFEIELLAVE